MVKKRLTVPLFAVAVALTGAAGCQLLAGIEDVHHDGLAEAGDTQVETSSETGPLETGLPDSTQVDSEAGALETGLPDTGDTGPKDTGSVAETEAGPPPCPSTSGTHPMVRITTPTGSYCMDVNEVTVAQMEAYDGATPSAPAGLPSKCAAVWDHWYPRDVGIDKSEPAINTNWCQAWAYCRWAGKRLCRSIDTKAAISAANSELGWACGQGATKSPRPYGTTYVKGTCDVESGRSTPIAITTTPACHGTTAPYDKVLNLIGSAEEWSEECPDATSCLARGGYFGHASNVAVCAYEFKYALGAQFASLGFRCCAD